MHADPRPAPRPAPRTTVSSPTPWIIAGVLLAVVGAGGVYWALRESAPAPTASAPAAAPATEPSAVAPPPIRHPIEQAPAAAAAEPAPPLPALGDSDALLFEALAALLGDDAWRNLVAGDFLIQRFVATVDNLPRRKLAPHLLPVKPAAGTLVVEGTPESATLSAANAARYDGYIRVLQSVDAQRLVALYVRLYPLFQQAYRELGGPEAYFNDRLVEVIDHLLAAPRVEPPIALVRPKVFWEFADPALEQASAGEKLMLRLGPAHAASVRAKLAEVRALLVAQAPAAP
jgi:hypothetical protein